MRVEATKVTNGFLIPFIGDFKRLKRDKILLDIEIVDQRKIKTKEADYSPLDALIGICDSGVNDASVNHDKRIYINRGEDDIR
jgi:hypothetical protein